MSLQAPSGGVAEVAGGSRFFVFLFFSMLFCFLLLHCMFEVLKLSVLFLVVHVLYYIILYYTILCYTIISLFFEVLHFTKILKLDLHRLLQLLDQLGFFEISRSGLFVSDSDSAHELMLSPLIDHWTLECHDRCLSLAQGWVARQTTNIIADPGMGCLTTVAGCPISLQIASAFCSTAVPPLFHCCFRLDYQLSAQSHMIYNDFMICW